MRRRIGSGAFATVWLAYDEHLDSPVAIKVLADNWTGDLHIRQRFLEEGRFLRKVESPHVVTVYDAGELADDRPYLVMAYADQGTLADRLELAALEPGQALAVIQQVGRGLTALHDRGVLHRDVKPANVLFRTVENARGSQVLAMVGDLGLGKAMDMSSRLTMVGGTPTYVAPEQALGEGLDARADQFSLAALSYYLLAGRQPYHHKTLAAAENPAPPAPMGIDNPEAEAVVARALAKDRADRYEDVEAFTTALVDAMGGEVGEAPQAWIPADADLTRTAPRTELADGVAGRTAVHGHPPASSYGLGGGRRARAGRRRRGRLGVGAGRDRGPHAGRRHRHDLGDRPREVDRRGRARAVDSRRGRARSSRPSAPAAGRAGTPTTTPPRASSWGSWSATSCPPACRSTRRATSPAPSSRTSRTATTR